MKLRRNVAFRDIKIYLIDGIFDDFVLILVFPFYFFCSTSQVHTTKMMSWSGNTSNAHFHETSLLTRVQSLAIKFHSDVVLHDFLLYLMELSSFYYYSCPSILSIWL